MPRTGRGLLARFTPIQGVTPADALSHPIWLQAILNSPQIISTANHSEYDTISAGQFSQGQFGPAGATQLREFSWETMLLFWDAEWLAFTGQNPSMLGDALQSILEWKKPVKLLLTWQPKGEVQTHTDVTFRTVTREFRHGENDVTYITLSMKEWRDPRVRVRAHRTHHGGTTVVQPGGTRLPAPGGSPSGGAGI